MGWQELQQVYPAGVAGFQAVMPLGRDGNPIQLGLMSDLQATKSLDQSGKEWVYLEAPELTREALAAVFDLAAGLGFAEPESMFVCAGPPEGFYFPEDD